MYLLFCCPLVDVPYIECVTVENALLQYHTVCTAMMSPVMGIVLLNSVFAVTFFLRYVVEK